ncbi:hypothetical protein AKJ61_01615 [candidate division MSBL1 archaeon SCGC-AAA259B11]|uniref:Uncharacterized protein n=1 Tax=candidate division MSBL1 archaeon SCGC-AAA259B11 TaxID=1698260 RepID=A0A133U740_9EURY|nr:hypothetical protein AKJ61_01615 [candidate division MSBL1 archaeon SCGC-AAA259B11]
MKIPEEETKEFHEVYEPLLAFANKELSVLEEVVDPDPAGWKRYVEDLGRVRDELYDNPGVIDKFIDENPEEFGPKRLKMVRKWREHFLRGRFFIVKYLKKYTVFSEFRGSP